MEMKTVGTDLAKNVFEIHGMKERGKPKLRKQLRFAHHSPDGRLGVWRVRDLFA
ncbi:hypothetical protein J2W17_005814 [Pseudomonas lini]|jgi:hypothetical protein|uniref:hypothetical protein n=1 Tax=Pseudomonas lini TaxID=163011 RepID=UPI00278A3C0A|nr:hypothetical protein [Pseudomonas lini]MDQ0126818.1 hypothetical protein [Pseudomonas lini]